MARFKLLDAPSGGYIDTEAERPTSYPADHPDVLAWIEDGNTPDPADPEPERPPAPDFGTDASTADQIREGVTQLRAYLALSSPTAAQTVGALKLTIRGLLFLLRRSF